MKKILLTGLASLVLASCGDKTPKDTFDTSINPALDLSHPIYVITTHTQETLRDHVGREIPAVIPARAYKAVDSQTGNQIAFVDLNRKSYFDQPMVTEAELSSVDRGDGTLDEVIVYNSFGSPRMQLTYTLEGVVGGSFEGHGSVCTSMGDVSDIAQGYSLIFIQLEEMRRNKNPKLIYRNQ
mgnify:FL=1